MANSYRDWSKGRIPAAGDLNWNDEVDDNFDIIETLLNNIAIRQNRVISGVLITDNGGLGVAYASGVIEVNGTRYSITGSTLTLTAGSPGGRLKNYIYVNSSGTVVDSTTLPTGQFVMLSIADTDDTDILRLSDLRIFAPASIRFSDGVSVNEFSSDATLGGASPSSSAVPVESAVQEYVLTNRRQYRNIIYNGAMAVAQRATSVTGQTSGGYFTLDRWRVLLASAGTFGYSKNTISPSGFGWSMKADCEVAQASLSAGAVHLIEQRLEGFDLQHLAKGSASAMPLTMQFWVRSSKTGTYIVELLDNDNTRHICASYTIDSADTWEYKTITFAGDTTGGFDKDNDYSLSIRWWLAAGSNYTSGTLATSWATVVNANKAVGQVNLSDSDTNDFYITGIQVEPGSYDGPFEHLSQNGYEHHCYRYYFESSVTASTANASTTTAVINSFISFPNLMRIAPSTFTISGVSLPASLGTYSSVSTWNAKRNGISPLFIVSGATAGYAGFATYIYTADAEL